MTARIAVRPLTISETAVLRDGFAAIREAQGLGQTRRRYSAVVEGAERMLGAAQAVADHRWCYLAEIWVAEGARGAGLGTRLLSEIEAQARAAGHATLYAWTASFEAPGFYAARGFRPLVRLSDFYAPGLDRLGFAKDIG